MSGWKIFWLLLGGFFIISGVMDMNITAMLIGALFVYFGIVAV